MNCPRCRAAGRTVGLHCVYCGRHVYGIQSPQGERMLVDHHGKICCPARTT